MEGPVLYRLHLTALPCDASGHTPRPWPQRRQRDPGSQPRLQLQTHSWLAPKGTSCLWSSAVSSGGSNVALLIVKWVNWTHWNANYFSSARLNEMLEPCLWHIGDTQWVFKSSVFLKIWRVLKMATGQGQVCSWREKLLDSNPCLAKCQLVWPSRPFPKATLPAWNAFVMTPTLQSSCEIRGISDEQLAGLPYDGNK